MSSFSISLGNMERTLRYEDAFGTILFSFDVDTTGKRNFVILERPLNRLDEIDTVNDERKRTAQRERVNAAFDRTREHLVQQGHEVKIWPDEFEKGPARKTK
jgi:hypothetical protein